MMCCKKRTYHVAHDPLHEVMALCPPIAPVITAILVSPFRLYHATLLSFGRESSIMLLIVFNLVYFTVMEQREDE